MSSIEFDVSGAVAALNQTLEYAYPSMTVIGEVSELRVSREKWVYFDIKDNESRLKCFASVWQIKIPIENGMKVAVFANPKLHNLYGFSLTVMAVKPVGEGSIKKAQDLLRAKLETEGLFASDRKRPIPYAPERIGLIASAQSAAYADFIKIMDERWRGVEVLLYDAQVQGEAAEQSLVDGVQYFNQSASNIDVLVMIRGGGSSEDLAAFSTEPVVRAVAGSRVPTVVAIGHEVDTALAELVADLAASTPSNAAELLFPDRQAMKTSLSSRSKELARATQRYYTQKETVLLTQSELLKNQILQLLHIRELSITHARSLLASTHPQNTLKRGFAIVTTKQGKLVRRAREAASGQELKLQFEDDSMDTRVERVY